MILKAEAYGMAWTIQVAARYYQYNGAGGAARIGKVGQRTRGCL
jgi:hypothetical protein